MVLSLTMALRLIFVTILPLIVCIALYCIFNMMTSEVTSYELYRSSRSRDIQRGGKGGVLKNKGGDSNAERDYPADNHKDSDDYKKLKKKLLEQIIQEKIKNKYRNSEEDEQDYMWEEAVGKQTVRENSPEHMREEAVSKEKVEGHLENATEYVSDDGNRLRIVSEVEYLPEYQDIQPNGTLDNDSEREREIEADYLRSDIPEEHHQNPSKDEVMQPSNHNHTNSDDQPSVLDDSVVTDVVTSTISSEVRNDTVVPCSDVVKNPITSELSNTTLNELYVVTYAASNESHHNISSIDTDGDETSSNSSAPSSAGVDGTVGVKASNINSSKLNSDSADSVDGAEIPNISRELNADNSTSVGAVAPSNSSEVNPADGDIDMIPKDFTNKADPSGESNSGSDIADVSNDLNFKITDGELSHVSRDSRPDDIETSHDVTQLCPSSRNMTRTLVTMFTTMKLKDSKTDIYLNTLNIWRQLGPSVRVVMYLDDEDCNPWMVLLIRDMGWEIRAVPKKHHLVPIPTIRHMFLDVIDSYNSTFYMYANADMLFDESLVNTLHKLETEVDLEQVNHRVLVIGKRRNYVMSVGERFHSIPEVTAASYNAPLFTQWAMDYFITTDHSFQWQDIPDFVVGRIRYDNWLLAHAIESGVVAVDATSSLVALHQSGVEGSRESLAVDFINVNTWMAGAFNILLGRTFCAPMKTYTATSGIILIEKKVVSTCRKSYRRSRIIPVVFHNYKSDSEHYLL